MRISWLNLSLIGGDVDPLAGGTPDPWGNPNCNLSPLSPEKAEANPEIHHMLRSPLTVKGVIFETFTKGLPYVGPQAVICGDRIGETVGGPSSPLILKSSA